MASIASDIQTEPPVLFDTQSHNGQPLQLNLSITVAHLKKQAARHLVHKQHTQQPSY